MAIDSPAAILFDSDGNPVVVQVEGNYYQLGSSDQGTQELLGEILTELKKLNVQLAMITDYEIRGSDI